jgi:hypothetical protein
VAASRPGIRGPAEQLCVQLQECRTGFVHRAVDRAVAVEPKLVHSTTTAVQELHYGPDAVAGRLCLSSAEYPHFDSVYENTIWSSTEAGKDKVPHAITTSGSVCPAEATASSQHLSTAAYRRTSSEPDDARGYPFGLTRQLEALD